ncbi:putative uncharacterized protein FLJ45840 [Diceros bicornis minor]|uniref:putative uncharacterized protein FLJ45840 n=1 Tax=Diceros bicornis minor TaxID=77932 RepID=UPI0026F1278A|nr:putative uncharacterized protein FLJ45840 [Diceros bicornis minor]
MARRAGARRTLALRRGEGGDAEAPALAPAPADVRTQAWLRPRGPRLLPGRGGWRLAAGGGGEGAEEGGRERGGRLPPAPVRRGSSPASERKQSPAPPPRPLLPLLSQQRGVRHRVALRRRVTPLGVTAPRPAAPAWSSGRPHSPAWPWERGRENWLLGSSCRGSVGGTSGPST